MERKCWLCFAFAGAAASTGAGPVLPRDTTAAAAGATTAGSGGVVAGAGVAVAAAATTGKRGKYIRLLADFFLCVRRNFLVRRKALGGKKLVWRNASVFFLAENEFFVVKKSFLAGREFFWREESFLAERAGRRIRIATRSSLCHALLVLLTRYY